MPRGCLRKDLVEAAIRALSKNRSTNPFDQDPAYRKSFRRTSSTMCSADKIALTELWRGVHVLQMTLGFRSRLEILNARVDGAFDNHVRTRAEAALTRSLLLDGNFSRVAEH